MHPHIAGDPKFRRLFRHEMQSMAKFRHPYAVSLYEGSLDGDPAGPGIVMEYVEGETLEKLLRRDGRPGLARVGRLLTHLGYALDAAHRQGIVHRDLKPTNLMVRDPGT